MDIKDIYFCDPCKFVGNNVTALKFCKQCESFMCKLCLKAHRQSKNSKGHTFVDTDKAMANGVVTKCDIHRYTVESVCKTHDVLCCRECIANDHRLCLGFVPIQRAAEGIHGTKVVQETKASLEQMISRSDKLKQGEKDAITGITNQSKMFEESVKKFRKDMNVLLDQLEEAMLQNKNEICKEEQNVVEQRLKVCEVVNAELTKAGKRMNTIDAKSDEQATFIVMKKSKDIVEKYKDVVDELVEGKGKFSIKFQPNKDLVKVADSIGSITVKSTVQPFGAFEIKSQVAGKTLVQVGEIDVSSPSDTFPCTITGCALLDDSRLVLADETNGSLKVLGNDFKIVADLKLDASPWDVAVISTDELAVRSSFSDNDKSANKIDIVKVGIDHLKKDREITVDGRPRAITSQKSNLYVACSDENKAQILVLKGKDFTTTKTIKPRKGVLNQPQYIVISPSSQMIYISDFYNGIVALNLKGDIMFKFKDSSVTEYGGITIDTSGDLYICAGKPYGIYHVIKDGKALSALTTWKSGTIDPQAIMYNPNDGKFLVTCCTTNKALVFCWGE